MTNALPIAGIILACAAGIGFKCISTPGTAADQWMQHTATPAIQRTIHRVQRLPFVNLLNWENGYQPRPTTRPLQVVSPAATGYTPEELSEIYPSH
ncbi:MAG: hypothetical protein IKZ07_07130 [Akkermansia sp.]|nr:hypothetical protein [Akkermansia sp.]